MNQLWRGLSAVAVGAILTVAPTWTSPAVMAAEPAARQSSWFDPTQLPSFTGVVDRYLPSPGGRPDRLVFKEGPQIVFPPDAFDEIREIAPPGRQLVVWGIRARSAAVITVLAFGPPDGEPAVLDRFYWRPDPGARRGNGREMQLIGTVWVPYLSPQGQTAGAILENGDVVRVEPQTAAMFKDRFAAGAKLVAVGSGSEGTLGRAIDAEKVGESIETLTPLPRPEPRHGGARPAAR